MEAWLFMGSYWDMEYRYLTMAELNDLADKFIMKARKKGEHWEPVVTEGKKIAKSWWGKAWCDNLERYADYYSRLDRGRRYVRAGAVADLRVYDGIVKAKVVGSGSKPYDIKINISPLKQDKMQEIIKQCSGRLKNAEDLMMGNFPKDMEEILLKKGMLFPLPQEISFSCSCPDWADMCKHVAAALYGVGTRLDTDPVLFFTLRGIDLTGFIDATILNRVEKMLENANTTSSRIMDENEIKGLFGVL